MAKNSNQSTTESAEDNVENTETQERSDPIDVGPDKGGNLLAAWRGIFHLLGGRGKFDLVPGEGIVVKGFSTFSKYAQPSTVLADVSGRDRRVDLIDSLPILQGNDPPAFTEPLDMTKWMQQYFRKPGEDGKSPQYIKDAIAAYKAANGFPGRRGRPKKIIRIDQLGKLDVATLAQVNPEELDALEALINKVRAGNNGENSSAESTATAGATA